MDTFLGELFKPGQTHSLVPRHEPSGWRDGSISRFLSWCSGVFHMESPHFPPETDRLNPFWTILLHWRVGKGKAPKGGCLSVFSCFTKPTSDAKIINRIFWVKMKRYSRWFEAQRQSHTCCPPVPWLMALRRLNSSSVVKTESNFLDPAGPAVRWGSSRALCLCLLCLSWFIYPHMLICP